MCVWRREEGGGKERMFRSGLETRMVVVVIWGSDGWGGGGGDKW